MPHFSSSRRAFSSLITSRHEHHEIISSAHIKHDKKPARAGHKQAN